MHTSTFFFATKTHFVKVIESRRKSSFQCHLECFPIPSAPETPQSDFLYLSHHPKVLRGLWMRRCTVIRESTLDIETGEISFTLCGLGSCESDGATLKVLDVCLKPDGSASLMEFQPTTLPLKSLCVGSSGCGVAHTEREQMVAFLLRYHRPGVVSFPYTILDHKFPASELLALDTFAGVAFFVHRSGDRTSVEVVDFGCRAGRSNETELW